jgi:hypothetical protein
MDDAAISADEALTALNEETLAIEGAREADTELAETTD